MTDKPGWEDACRERLRYAEGLFDAQHERYGWLEEKSARYLVAVSLLFGALGVVIWPTLRERVQTAGADGLEKTFFGVAVVAAVAGLSSLLGCLSAMDLHPVPSPSMEVAALKAFDLDGCDIHQLRVHIADRHREAAVKACERNDSRADHLAQAFASLRAFLVSICILVVIALAMERWSPVDGRREGEGQGTGAATESVPGSRR